MSQVEDTESLDNREMQYRMAIIEQAFHNYLLNEWMREQERVNTKLTTIITIIIRLKNT